MVLQFTTTSVLLLEFYLTTPGINYFWCHVAPRCGDRPACSAGLPSADQLTICGLWFGLPTASVDTLSGLVAHLEQRFFNETFSQATPSYKFMASKLRK